MFVQFSVTYREILCSTFPLWLVHLNKHIFFVPRHCMYFVFPMLPFVFIVAIASLPLLLFSAEICLQVLKCSVLNLRSLNLFHEHGCLAEFIEWCTRPSSVSICQLQFGRRDFSFWLVGDLLGHKSLLKGWRSVWLQILILELPRSLSDHKFPSDKNNHPCPLLSLDSPALPMYYVVREFAVNLCIRISYPCSASKLLATVHVNTSTLVLCPPPNFWIVLLSNSGWECSTVCRYGHPNYFEEMHAARIPGQCAVKSYF